MSKGQRPMARGGFSLIELLAAMMIFSVGVVACIELYTVNLQSTTDSLDYTQAVYLAQGLMEQTLADEYLVATTDSGDFGQANPRHTWETAIEETESKWMMEVRVTVKWTSRGREHQHDLATLYADRNLYESGSEMTQ